MWWFDPISVSFSPAPSPFRTGELTFSLADVALITGLEDTAALDAYFSQFLLPAQSPSPASSLKLLSAPDWTKVEKVLVSHNFAVSERPEREVLVA